MQDVGSAGVTPFLPIHPTTVHSSLSLLTETIVLNSLNSLKLLEFLNSLKLLEFLNSLNSLQLLILLIYSLFTFNCYLSIVTILVGIPGDFTATTALP